MDARTLSVLLAGTLVMVGRCNAEPAVVRSPLAGVLVINEFMAANSRTIPDEYGEFADWIELYNDGSAAVNLRTVFLTDDLTKPMKWGFPDTVIRPGEYLLVWADGEYRQGPLHVSFRLSAEGEQLGLFSTDGDHLFMIDTLSFEPQGEDTSLGRIPNGTGEWRRLAVPTPGAENSSGISPLAGVLLVNEIMASNQSTIVDEAGDYDDWLEIYNSGSTPAALGGLTLTDNLAQPLKWALPDTTLVAGGHLLVWADDEENEGPLHACFNLGAVRGEQIGLFALEAGHPVPVDTLSFGPQHADTSYGRLPDGGPEWRFLPSPTPGAANRGRK